MESIKTPKRIIKKQIKNVNKAIIEITEMKFKNIEEKEEKYLVNISDEEIITSYLSDSGCKK